MVLIIANVIYRPSFVSIRILDGHLFGSLIDILRQSAPLILIALGMTLVIATGGIDLSVGSVVAICGAVAVSARQRAGQPEQRQRRAGGLAHGAVAGALLGLWNGFLVAGHRHHSRSSRR